MLDYGGVKIDALTTVSSLRHLRRLRRLNIAPGVDVGDFSGFPSLPQLMSISISENRVIRSLDALRRFPELREVDASQAVRLDDISALEDLSHLQFLELNFCSSLEDFEAIGRLPSLRRLHLMHDHQGNFDFLTTGQPVELLDTDGAPELVDISGLGAVAGTLRHLDAQDCLEVFDWSVIGSLTNLNLLIVSNTWFGASIDYVRSLAKLQVFTGDRAEIDDLSPLAGLSALRNISLRGNEHLTDLSPLAPLTPRILDISGTAVVDLAPILHWRGAVIRVPSTLDLDALPSEFRMRNRVMRLRAA
jgi:hypothetical protein